MGRGMVFLLPLSHFPPWGKECSLPLGFRSFFPFLVSTSSKKWTQEGVGGSQRAVVVFLVFFDTNSWANTDWSLTENTFSTAGTQILDFQKRHKCEFFRAFPIYGVLLNFFQSSSALVLSGIPHGLWLLGFFHPAVSFFCCCHHDGTSPANFFFFLINLFIYLFLAVLGLCCCAWLSLVAASRGYSSLWCAGFSSWWLLLLRSTGSRHAGLSSCGSRALECRLSSCGARAQLLRSMGDLPGPGLELVSPALAGGFLTTAPPGKPPS